MPARRDGSSRTGRATRENFDATHTREGLKSQARRRRSVVTRTQGRVGGLRANQRKAIVKRSCLLWPGHDARKRFAAGDRGVEFSGALQGQGEPVHSTSAARVGRLRRQVVDVGTDNRWRDVIHVNMLKEAGSNVPVSDRAAGRRTREARGASIGAACGCPRQARGVAAVDRLTIVSHDNFQ